MVKKLANNHPTEVNNPLGTNKGHGLSLALVLGSSVVAAVITSLISPVLVSKLKQSPSIVVRAEPPIVDKGHEARIIWESRRATEVIIKPQNTFMETNGELRIKPNETSTYTVVGRSWLGEEISSSVQVVVNEAPAIAFIPKPNKQKTGLSKADITPKILRDDLSLATPEDVNKYDLIVEKSKVYRLEWGCEETKPIREIYSLQANDQFVSAEWVLLGSINAKSYTLQPPQYSNESKTVMGDASFRGLDRVFFNCPGGGHAELQMRITLRRPNNSSTDKGWPAYSHVTPTEKVE